MNNEFKNKHKNQRSLKLFCKYDQLCKYIFILKQNNLKMSQQLINERQHIQQSHKQSSLQSRPQIENLPEPWTIWFSYSSDSSNDINYGNNLMKIQKIASWNQFALIWTWLDNTDKFFMNMQTGLVNKFKFGNEQRKVDSINFFKWDNQPQWEYGDNEKCGYFNFGVERYEAKINEIYEATVFLALGGTQQIAQNVVGIRIVDLAVKPNHPSRARIEIWVDFRHDNSKQSIQKLSYFQNLLQKYYRQKINYELNQIKFFNISNLDKSEVKSPNKNSSQGYKASNAHKKYKKK